jgi:hypothetical protein
VAESPPEFETIGSRIVSNGLSRREISTDGHSLNIRPLHKRTLAEAKLHIRKNLGKAMEKLAK